jgi:hypothetical protein
MSCLRGIESLWIRYWSSFTNTNAIIHDTSPSRDCAVIERRWVKTGQAAGFQSFRMRMFRVRDYCRWHKKLNSFLALKFLSLMVQRLRSKAFSPVCLSRFLEFLPLIPITTQPLRTCVGYG